MSGARETKLSENTSFTIEDIPNKPGMVKATFFYQDPERKNENLIFVIGTPEEPKPIEHLMKYDESTKTWVVELEKSKDVSEMFWMIPASVVDDPENVKIPPLQIGHLVFKNGELQPTSSFGVPQGNQLIFLLKPDGELTKVDKPDEKSLKTGERYITIHTPHGYNPNRKPPYKLQVILDGQQYKDYMKMPNIVDNLTEKKAIDPPVTVFISSYSGPPDVKKPGFSNVAPPGYDYGMRLREYCANPAVSDQLALLPKTVAAYLNISLESKDITLWGVSAGGLCATYTALLHPDVFGNVVAQSPMAWNIPTQNGDHWREGIVGNNWETSTAPLPEKEGEHNEHLTQMVRSGYDEISKRKLDTSQAITFYFDAGEKEKIYDAKAGYANLVKATEVLIEALKEKKHEVIDDKIHLLPGSHFIMTWIRNIADIERTLHATKPALEKEKKPLSSTIIAKTMAMDLSKPALKEDMPVEKSLDTEKESIATTPSTTAVIKTERARKPSIVTR